MAQSKQLRILFADDQIPSEDISDDQIGEVLKAQHPRWNEGFIGAFYKMRRIVKALNDAGYSVTVARSYAETLELINHAHFDIAIVDLGWAADETLPTAQRDTWGWKICEDIDKANAKTQSKPTAQLMCSSRFFEKREISIEAANRGILPVYKDYARVEITVQTLKASIRFIETLLKSRSPADELAIKLVIDLQNAMTNSLTEPLVQQKQWSRLTLIFVALSVLLVFVGAVSAIFGNIQFGTLSSISSILTTVISSLLFVQLQRSQKMLENNQEITRQEFKEAIERLKSISQTSNDT
jgi:CheY-like chemotaxis protein